LKSIVSRVTPSSPLDSRRPELFLVKISVGWYLFRACSVNRTVGPKSTPPSQAFETDEAGNLLLIMEVGGLDEVMSWVLGFGRQAEVLSPAHLRKAVAEEAQAVAGRYEDDAESDHSRTPIAKDSL